MLLMKLGNLAENKVVPKQTIEDLPLIKGFMATAYESSASINEFYEERTKLTAKVSTSKVENPTLKAQLSAMNKSASELSAIRKQINSIYDSGKYTAEKKKEMIDIRTKQMVNIARGH